jgi:hypothetical protein
LKRSHVRVIPGSPQRILGRWSNKGITQSLITKFAESGEYLRISAAVTNGLDARGARGLDGCCNLLVGLWLALNAAVCGAIDAVVETECFLAPSDVLRRDLRWQPADDAMMANDIERAGNAIWIALIQRLNLCIFPHDK